MKYLSLFSGIEATTVAWEPLGWEPVAFAEFDDFPKAVLAYHYPNVPDLGDVTKITKEQIIALGHIDIVVGGSPCQDLSVAGKRAGMRNEDGYTTRSGLFDEQMRIFEIAKEFCGARYLLWENVPGAFSSNKGLDFAYVLGSMVGGSIHVPADRWKNSGVAVSGNGRRLVEWRVLDAQNFGVPQRRRRIFALLDTGAWWSRQPILFEQEGVCGDTPQSRGKGEGIAERTGNCFTPSSFGGYKAGVGTLRSNGGDLGGGSETIIYENHANDSRVTESVGVCPTLHSQMGTGGGVMDVEYNKTGTLRRETHGHEPCVMMEEMVFQLVGDRDNPSVSVSDKAYCLPANPMSDRGQGVYANTVVRRLTPVECERLQGFPDNWTNIPWRGKPSSPDGKRYKAIGNSMAVPVMQWIGKRMLEAKQVVCDEVTIDRILYVTPSDDGQLSLF